MASDLDPSTAGWTTSSTLGTTGENLTVAQQNAAMENGGWLFANTPHVVFEREIEYTRADGIQAGGDSGWGTAYTFQFYHPAGIDYFMLVGTVTPAASSKGFIRFRINGTQAGTDLGWSTGTYGWRGMTTGTVSGVTNNALVQADILSHGDSAGKQPYMRGIRIYGFGKDIGLPDGWINAS